MQIPHPAPHLFSSSMGKAGAFTGLKVRLSLWGVIDRHYRLPAFLPSRRRRFVLLISNPEAGDTETQDPGSQQQE